MIAPGDPHQTALFLRWLAGQIEDGLLDIRTQSWDSIENRYELTVYEHSLPPPPGPETLYFCRRCDLSYCGRHLRAHFEHPGLGPTREAAVEYGLTHCAVCSGIQRDREPAS